MDKHSSVRIKEKKKCEKYEYVQWDPKVKFWVKNWDNWHIIERLQNRGNLKWKNHIDQLILTLSGIYKRYLPLSVHTFINELHVNNNENVHDC